MKKGLWILISQIPPLGGVISGFFKGGIAPRTAVGLAIRYEVILFAIAFGKKVWKELEQDAVALAEEKQLLRKQDPEYLERIAREKYGLVKPGETIYELVPVTKKH